MSDGVGPLMLKMLVEDLCNSEAAFTLMYDETTTVQVKKQMDILVRYWSESEQSVCQVSECIIFWPCQRC